MYENQCKQNMQLTNMVAMLTINMFDIDALMLHIWQQWASKG